MKISLKITKDIYSKSQMYRNQSISLYSLKETECFSFLAEIKSFLIIGRIGIDSFSSGRTARDAALGIRLFLRLEVASRGGNFSLLRA